MRKKWRIRNTRKVPRGLNKALGCQFPIICHAQQCENCNSHQKHKLSKNFFCHYGLR